MIARHEASEVAAAAVDAVVDAVTLWARLSAPLAEPLSPDAVRRRLDACCAGEHDLTLDLLPAVVLPATETKGERAAVAFKARLQILGVIREGVGMGATYEGASARAFLAAARMFGIAGDVATCPPAEPTPASRPAESAAAATPPSDRREEERSVRPVARVEDDSARDVPHGAPRGASSALGTEDEVPDCPSCSGPMWDNRLTRRNPKAPIFKCKDRACDGVVWPPRSTDGGRGAAMEAYS